jgi:hypothetical protein
VCRGECPAGVLSCALVCVDWCVRAVVVVYVADSASSLVAGRVRVCGWPLLHLLRAPRHAPVRCGAVRRGRSAHAVLVSYRRAVGVCDAVVRTPRARARASVGSLFPPFVVASRQRSSSRATAGATKRPHSRQNDREADTRSTAINNEQARRSKRVRVRVNAKDARSRIAAYHVEIHRYMGT